MSLNQKKLTVLSYCDPNLLYHTRIHPLPTLHTNHAKVYVKREDESGFGISGCKKRKYASIFFYLHQNKIKKVLLTGGINSNHICSCLQLLNERKIDAHLWLKRPHSSELKGNGFLTGLLLKKHLIEWIPSNKWSQINTLANTFIANENDPIFFIPEGGSCKEAVAGLCTLYEDVLQNEKEQHIIFDHIFLDAGTGMTAGIFAIMSTFHQHNRNLHIVLMAEDEQAFKTNLSRWNRWVADIYRISPLPLPNINYYFPTTARSFGSVNQTVLQEIKYLAEFEGILTDPIYSAKLFMTARHYIIEKKLEGNVLIVHSGGGTGLTGFQDRFHSPFDV